MWSTRTRNKFINLTTQSAFGASHHLESQFTRHSLQASSPLILGELQEIPREETQGAVSLTAPFTCNKWGEQVTTGCKTWRSIDSHPESNPQHHMGCVRPFKEGIGFSHHTGVCSKGQTQPHPQCFEKEQGFINLVQQRVEVLPRF